MTNSLPSPALRFYQQVYPLLRDYTQNEQTLLATALDLFRRPSPSRQEALVRTYVVNRLRDCDFQVQIDRAGNVLATRGHPPRGQGYPLLSCHLDQVSFSNWVVKGGRRQIYPQGREYQQMPTQIGGRRNGSEGRRASLQILPPQAIVFTNHTIHTNQHHVLGGDDKCGVSLMLMAAYNSRKPLKVVASVQEEIGCVGIRQVDHRFFSDVAYALVLDRREAHDLVTSIGRRDLCSLSFAEQVLEAAWQVNHWALPIPGMLSDALELSRWISEVVNLSVGYYLPHGVREYVDIGALLTASAWVEHCLACLPRSLPPPRKSYLFDEDLLSEEALCLWSHEEMQEDDMADSKEALSPDGEQAS